MNTGIKELSRAYQIWTIIQHSPGINLSGIAKAMGCHSRNVSDAVTKLRKAGCVTCVGKKGFRCYSAVKSSPPEMYGRGSYRPASEPVKQVIFMKPTPGNPVFEECRQNWPGYELNKRLREVRA